MFRVKRRAIISMTGAMLLFAFSGATFAWSVGLHSAAESQTPYPIKVDYATPPHTWAEARARADLVAIIRLKARTYLAEGATDLPKTRFEADVIEVVGGNRAASVGREIAVIRYGGMMQAIGGARPVEEAGFPSWSVGSTILVFLRWIPATETYSLPFGPNAAFELDASTQKIKTAAASELGVRQQGRPFADLVKDVKAVKR